MKLTQARVRELFDYREDGQLVRRVTVGSSAQAGDLANHCRPDGYLGVGIDGKYYLCHRIVWLWYYGYLPENQVDHIDRDRSNNRILNLREVNQTCNLRNGKVKTTNTSRITGVGWHKRIGKWTSQIMNNNKRVYLGYSTDFTEAVALRLTAEQCLKWEGCDSSSPAYQYMRGITCKKDY